MYKRIEQKLFHSSLEVSASYAVYSRLTIKSLKEDVKISFRNCEILRQLVF